MNKGVKRVASLFLAAVMLVSTMVVGVSAANNDTTDSVGALLDGFTAGSGTFTLSANSRIFVVAEEEPSGDLLQTAQLIQREFKARFTGYELEMVWGPETYPWTGDVVIHLDETSATGADGYKLDVTETTAVITAEDTDGLIYGANTILKMFNGGSTLCGFTAYDTPDTKERTVHLDTARKYYTAEWICNFIRQLSWMGYNALEVHVSEDGGFRGDFWDETYYQETDTDGDGYTYKPANDFSWLCGSHIQSWVEEAYRNDPDAGKYLTAAELIQICDVAKEYHIEIIPSFDSPAHMDYITWKFEQNYKKNEDYSFTYNEKTYEASDTNGCINYTNTTGISSPVWPYYSTIDITDGTMAKAFVFAIYADMADFFKEYAGSTKFNIGADEVNLTSYAGIYPRTWKYSEFPGYVNDLNRMLNGKGYTVRMFNDFIGSTTYNQKDSKAVYEFDKNIEILYWNSDFDPTYNTYNSDGNKTWHVAFFWHDGNGTKNVDESWPEKGWGDGGRTIYNGIQTHTYYALRVGTSGEYRDARDPNNRNWTFYHGTEEGIYNEWYPADISEKGVYSEDVAEVPEEHLGGAYFLIWNDYAAMNTEQEIWEGAPDRWHGKTTYYLFDRMYSNIIKMWNADVNNTVKYADFAAVRQTFGWFPGYTSCSAAASLPAATVAPTRANLTDHSALEAVLANKITDNGTYTKESYAAYEAAYEAAEVVHADHAATAEKITQALTNLNTAKEALVIIGDKATLQSAIANAEDKLGTENVYTDESLEALLTAVDAANAVYAKEEPTEAEVTSAIAAINNAITGLERIVPEGLVSVEDTGANTPAADTDFTAAYLNTLIRNAFPTDTAPYGVTAGWEKYKEAVEKAQQALDGDQEAINTAVQNLLAAENAIATSGDCEIISVSKISASASGSYITLKVVTNCNTPYISAFVEGAKCANTDIIAQGKLQKLKDGSVVKVWLVRICTTQDGDRLISGSYKIKGWVDKTINIVAE